MDENRDLISQAKNLLDNSFEPHQVAYFITKNGVDECGEDYCINCIKKQVKEVRKNYKQKRQAIIDKYKAYENLDKYSESEIKKWLKYALKEYPGKVKFDYEWHDPDFGGGRTNVATCGDCGEYFETNYYPDLQEAKYLLEDFADGKEVTPQLAWNLRVVFDNFNDNYKAEIQSILLNIAKRIIENHNTH